MAGQWASGARTGGAGPRAARKRGERGTGELGSGKEMTLTCGSALAVRGGGARPTRAERELQRDEWGAGTSWAKRDEGRAGPAEEKKEQAELGRGERVGRPERGKGRRSWVGPGWA